MPQHHSCELPAERFEAELHSVCGRFSIGPTSGQKLMWGGVSVDKWANIEMAIVANNLQRVIRSRRDIRYDHGENYFLIIQQEGRSLMAQNGSRAVLVPGDMIFVDSARPSEFTFFGDRSKQISLHLPRTEVQDFFGSDVQGGASLSREDPTARAIHAVVTKAVQSGRKSDNNMFLKHALYGLLGTFLFDDGTPAHKGVSQEYGPECAVLGRALDYVEMRYRDPEFSVCDIASALGVTMRQVQRAFNGIGVSPTKYVLGKRLELAREKVNRRNLGAEMISVSSIAYGAGFSDVSYFHRRFREAFGCAPGDYATDRHAD